MPRPPRIQFEGAFYHVYSRGNRRERIFLETGDYARFERFLIEAMNLCHVRLYNWCLMPNHFHLLIQTPNANLAEFMQCLLTRYAKFFNWKHGYIGHVFQGRFNARICDKDAYFKELIRYIQLNPYKTKGGPLAEIGTWKWSSHKYFMGMSAPQGLAPWIDEAFSFFAADRADARKIYAQFLGDGLSAGGWESFYKVKDRRFLGSDAFVQNIKFQNHAPARAQERDWVRIDSIEPLAARLLEGTGFEIAALQSKNQSRALGRLRQAIVYIARRHYRLPGVSIAKFLRRDQTAVSQMLRRMRDRPDILAEIQRGERLLRNDSKGLLVC